MDPAARPANLEEIRPLVAQITAAWRNGQPEKLTELFDEHMVIFGPGCRELARGRKACVRSYEEFLAKAVIHEYKQSEPAIRICGEAAVVTYKWEMVYTLNSRLSRETGTELIVFECRHEQWRVVLRVMQSKPKAD
jgi:uncharacterized protein (TIGR02246 family)